ncbi:MAG TPA: hypothetical protein VFA18_00430, partial [Gemmataceae bacterium]|nr:hypothetical protein [Gemmataceae bacterium]
PGPGQTLVGPPTELTVRFDKPVNLQQLAFEAFQQTAQDALAPVYIQGPQGRYYPRLEGFDPTTDQATFLMLDGLAPGTYQLHLSGPQGLTDLAGLPLVGNSPSGDYVVSFTVADSHRGTNGDPLLWTDREPNESFSRPLVLGTLFPHEVQAGVTIRRDLTPSAGDTADYYQVRVLQTEHYIISLTNRQLPGNSGVQLTLQDATGQVLATAGPDDGYQISAYLGPGAYVISVGAWSVGEAAGVSYQLHVTLDGVQENPPPLTFGPAPALSIRLVADAGSPQAPGGQHTPASAPSHSAVASSIFLPFTGMPPGVVSNLGTGPVGGVQLASLPATASEHLYVGMESQTLMEGLLQSLFATCVSLPDDNATGTPDSDPVDPVADAIPAANSPPPAVQHETHGEPAEAMFDLTDTSIAAAPPQTPRTIKTTPAPVSPVSAQTGAVLVPADETVLQDGHNSSSLARWSWVLALMALAATGSFSAWRQVRRRRIAVRPGVGQPDLCAEEW